MVFLPASKLFFLLIPICSFSVVTAATTISTTTSTTTTTVSTNPTTSGSLLSSHPSASIPTFPSCLQANTTWDAEEVTSVTPGINSPELCQNICQADPACVAITWTQPSFPVFPLSCATFSSTGNATECVDCVSGPPVCSCSIQGECETTEDNVPEILSSIKNEDDCRLACEDFNLCTNYTFLGPENPLRFVCFLLSSCEDFDLCTNYTF